MSKVTFQVLGSGRFPFPMLAHDKCYPASTKDAQLMLATSVGHGFDGPTPINLITDHYPKHPTFHRWKDAGWPIIKVSP